MSADIQLTADGSQAIATLKQIERQLTSLQSSFSDFAKKSSNDLDKVVKSTDLLAGSLGGLKKVIAALGIANALTSLSEYGTAIGNIERTTGITAGTIKSFGDAVSLAGGDGIRAAEDFIDFQNAIHDARTGSDSAAKSFSEVGVSLSELYNGNTAQIFDKVRTALVNMPDPATRSAVAVQLLGRQFKDLDVKKVLQDMDRFNSTGFADRSGEAAGIAKQIGMIGKTMSKLGKIFTEEVLLAFKDNIQAIADFATVLSKDRESIIKFVDTLKWLLDWAVTIGSFFLGGFLVKGVTKLITVFSEASVVVSDLAIKLGATGGVFSKFFKTIQSGASTTAVFFENVLLKISNKAAGASEKVSEIIASRSAGTRESIKSLIDDARQLQQRIVELGTTKAGNMKKRISEADRNQIISLGKELEQTKGEIGHLFKTRFDDTTKILGTSFSKLQGVLTGLSVVAVNFWDNLVRIWTGTDAAGKSLSGFESILHSVIKPVKDLVVYLWEGWGTIQKWIADLGPLGELVAALVAPFHSLAWLINDIFGHSGSSKTVQVLAEVVEGITEVLSWLPLVGGVFDDILAKQKQARAEASNMGRGNAKLHQEGWDKKAADDKKAAEDQAAADAARKKALEQQREEYAKIAKEITGIVDSYRKGNIQQEQTLQHAYDTFRMTAEEKQVADAVFEIEKKRVDQIEQLKQKMLDWQHGTEQQKASIGIIKQAMADVNKEAETTKAVVTDQLKINQAQERSYNNQKKNIEAVNAALLAQLGTNAQLREKLKDTMYERQTMGMGPNQKQMSDLKRQMDKDIAALEQQFSEAQFNLDTNASPEQMNDMFAQHNESIRLVRQEYEERKKTIEQSRTWSNGWTQAFNEYVDSATSAANLAAAQFNAFTRGMESAIDQFVESGKFSFGDFISSVIKDIAKAELKFAAAGFMKAMGMGGPGGSISGGIASWIGGFFAEGGTPPVGKPSVVGENGPELFIPKSAGTILPNGVMPQSQQQTPQPIINNTYVTNNIQAVDAKSVAQLFAENRKSLFGAVTQAKRELPGKFSAI